MQADLKRHIERSRQRVYAKKAVVDAKVADSDADWAQADAEDAIAFAMSAIIEAEYATLDAMLARENAAQLAASCLLGTPDNGGRLNAVWTLLASRRFSENMSARLAAWSPSRCG